MDLEPGRDFMPTYIGRRDGAWVFGTEAINLAENVHSLKPKLVEDEPLVDYPGFRPSDLARELLAEVVRRTLIYLQNQRILPASADRLTIATQLGCTAQFDLATRLRLRDVATAAGLNVTLPYLIEEPVAAAFELAYGGIISRGRVLIIDIGGGTTDVAVVKGDIGSRRFELYATRGSRNAGDRFTDVIADRLTNEVEQRLASTLGDTAARSAMTSLDLRSKSALWARAEAAKIDLSDRSARIVPLGGIAGLEFGEVELTRAWYQTACGTLRLQMTADIRDAFILARLVLDRGGDDDPQPGTLYYRTTGNGGRIRLSETPLKVDAPAHLDAVVAVGGASRSPVIQELLEAEFGPLLQDSFVDPVHAIALGLARGDRLDSRSLRYPGWEVVAEFVGPELAQEEQLYTPYASTMTLRANGMATYSRTIAVPRGASTVRLTFRPIPLTAEPARWPRLDLPAETTGLEFHLDLFGRIRLRARAGGTTTELLSESRDLRAPWMPSEGADLPPWLPRSSDPDWYKGLPTWNPYGEVG